MKSIVLFILLRLLLLCVFVPATISEAPMNTNGTFWAMLVAGSYGWTDYRHQVTTYLKYITFILFKNYSEKLYSTWLLIIHIISMFTFSIFALNENI